MYLFNISVFCRLVAADAIRSIIEEYYLPLLDKLTLPRPIFFTKLLETVADDTITYCMLFKIATTDEGDPLFEQLIHGLETVLSDNFRFGTDYNFFSSKMMVIE